MFSLLSQNDCNMRTQIADYLKDLTIGNRKELFEVLNFIAPLVDCWSLAEPKSMRENPLMSSFYSPKNPEGSAQSALR